VSFVPKIGQPRFLEVREVELANNFTTQTQGGLRGVRDPGLLASALAQPQAQFAGEFIHGFPFGMAAAYAFHIARNHPFLDGNKRTAFAAANSFLELQGWRLVASEEDAAVVMEQVAAGVMDKAAIESWLDARSHPRPTIELRDFFAMVNLDVISQAIDSAVASARPEEVVASLNESEAAIPLIKSLRAGADEALARGDHALASHWEMDAAMFAALYRIAEDMGYEW
jgi:death-on-curing protein